jgi:hypothetical protein
LPGGWLMRYQLRRIWLHLVFWRLGLAQLRRWLDGSIPARCPVCGRWSRPGGGWEWVQHTVAGWVRVCGECNRDLYGDGGRL